MATNDPRALLRRLLEDAHEGEWIEFKHNNCEPDLIGRTVAACANSAMLAERDRALIVWGIEDRTKRKIGTAIKLRELTQGSENFSNWISRVVEPRLMMEFLDFSEEGKDFSILIVDPTYDRPVKFCGEEYIRIG